MANVEQNVYSGIMIPQSCTWIGLIHSMNWLDWIGLGRILKDILWIVLDWVLVIVIFNVILVINSLTGQINCMWLHFQLCQSVTRFSDFHWPLTVAKLIIRPAFYPRDAMLARVIATATCLSVRLSRAGIVSKWRKLAAWFLHRLLAPRL